MLCYEQKCYNSEIVHNPLKLSRLLFITGGNYPAFIRSFKWNKNSLYKMHRCHLAMLVSPST